MLGFMTLTPFVALIAVLVGMMCGAGEGWPHGVGFAIAGGALGTAIGFAGAWVLFRFDRCHVRKEWGTAARWLAGVTWASAILWLPLLVGVASVLGSAGMVRLIADPATLR